MKFEVEKEVNHIVNFIRDYYQKNHLKGVVIGTVSYTHLKKNRKDTL